MEDQPRPSGDGAALVNEAYRWKRITPNTPRGMKLLLINREAGVLTHGQLSAREEFFTHFCELPVFADGE